MGTHPTLATPELLDDTERWHVLKDIPVFCAHRRKVEKDGKEKQVVVTDRELKEIVRQARQLDREDATAPGLWLGHRDPKKSEREQPDLVGLARNWRVGTWGPKQKRGILVDLYYDRRHLGEASKYPYRSAEFYDMSDEITGVALLKRDPQLDLGMILSARSGVPVFYAADVAEPDKKITEPPRKPKDDDEEDEDEAGKKRDEPWSPEEEKSYEHFHRCMRRYMAGSAMGPMDAQLPEQIKRAAGMDRDDPQNHDRLSRTGRTEYERKVDEKFRTMQKQLDDQTRQIRHDRDTVKQQMHRYARNESALIVERLLADGYRITNPEKLGEELAARDETGRVAYENEIREHWVRAPIAGDFLDTTDKEAELYARPSGQRDDGAGAAHAEPRGHGEAMTWMRANPGSTYESAMAHVNSVRAK